MKLNNKGFTVVELLASFTLTMIITTLLFEVVMELKDIYISSELETGIKNENALVARAVSREINNGNIPVDCGGDMCILQDGREIKVLSNQEIKVANRVYDATEATYINDDFSITAACSSDVALAPGSERCYLKINYVVSGENFSDDIPFNLVISYLG